MSHGQEKQEAAFIHLGLPKGIVPGKVRNSQTRCHICGCGRMSVGLFPEQTCIVNGTDRDTGGHLNSVSWGWNELSFVNGLPSLYLIKYSLRNLSKCIKRYHVPEECLQKAEGYCECVSSNTVAWKIRDPFLLFSLFNFPVPTPVRGRLTWKRSRWSWEGSQAREGSGWSWKLEEASLWLNCSEPKLYFRGLGLFTIALGSKKGGCKEASGNETHPNSSLGWRFCITWWSYDS